MFAKNRELAPRIKIPDARGAVPRTGDHTRAVGTDCYGADLLVMTGKFDKPAKALNVADQGDVAFDVHDLLAVGRDIQQASRVNSVGMNVNARRIRVAPLDHLNGFVLGFYEQVLVMNQRRVTGFTQ